MNANKMDTKPNTKETIGKTQFVSHTKHTQWKINEFTSFAIDNMYYVNFRI